MRSFLFAVFVFFALVGSAFAAHGGLPSHRGYDHSHWYYGHGNTSPYGNRFDYRYRWSD